MTTFREKKAKAERKDDKKDGDTYKRCNGMVKSKKKKGFKNRI